MIRILCILFIAGSLSSCTTESPPPYLMDYNNYYYTTSYGVYDYTYPVGYDDSYYMRNSGVIPY